MKDRPWGCSMFLRKPQGGCYKLSGMAYVNVCSKIFGGWKTPLSASATKPTDLYSATALPPTIAQPEISHADESVPKECLMRSVLLCLIAFFGLAPLTLAQAQPATPLALTPPMGWNSWNWFARTVTDKDIRQAADLMVSSGMRDAGYVYVNIDDAWEGQRDANGVLHSNEKFPDMKALADYVHGKGLKLGIYSSPGAEDLRRI